MAKQQTGDLPKFSLSTMRWSKADKRKMACELDSYLSRREIRHSIIEKAKQSALRILQHFLQELYGGRGPAEELGKLKVRFEIDQEKLQKNHSDLEDEYDQLPIKCASAEEFEADLNHLRAKVAQFDLDHSAHSNKYLTSVKSWNPRFEQDVLWAKGFLAFLEVKEDVGGDDISLKQSYSDRAVLLALLAPDTVFTEFSSSSLSFLRTRARQIKQNAATRCEAARAEFHRRKQQNPRLTDESVFYAMAQETNQDGRKRWGSIATLKRYKKNWALPKKRRCRR